jgi:hypothetical protein
VCAFLWAQAEIDNDTNNRIVTFEKVFWLFAISFNILIMLWIIALNRAKPGRRESHAKLHFLLLRRGCDLAK